VHVRQFVRTSRHFSDGLLYIPLDQIDEARLQALIDAGATKSHSIDYKRATLPRIDYRETYTALRKQRANRLFGER
jgi:hypothetical protein